MADVPLTSSVPSVIQQPLQTITTFLTDKLGEIAKFESAQITQFLQDHYFALLVTILINLSVFSLFPNQAIRLHQGLIGLIGNLVSFLIWPFRYLYRWVWQPKDCSTERKYRNAVEKYNAENLSSKWPPAQPEDETYGQQRMNKKYTRMQQYEAPYNEDEDSDSTLDSL